MDSYTIALRDWRTEFEKFVSHKFPDLNNKAKREKVTYSVPSIHRKEMDEFVASLREKADKNQTQFVKNKRIELEREFVKNNPMPKLVDF